MFGSSEDIYNWYLSCQRKNNNYFVGLSRFHLICIGLGSHLPFNPSFSLGSRIINFKCEISECSATQKRLYGSGLYMFSVAFGTRLTVRAVTFDTELG